MLTPVVYSLHSLLDVTYRRFGGLGLHAVLEHLAPAEGALGQEDDELVLLEVEGLPELLHLDGRRPLEGAAEEAVLVAAAVEVLNAVHRGREHLKGKAR